MHLTSGNEIFNFCRLNVFYENFKLLTSLAAKKYENPILYFDACKLNRIYRITELFIKFLKEHPDEAVLVEGRLKSINVSAFPFGSLFTGEDFFSVKQLLLCVKTLSQTLPAEIINEFGYSFKAQAFLEKLQKGGGGNSFYIASIYNEELLCVREEIQTLSLEIEKIEAAVKTLIKEKHGFDFSFCDFLIISKSKIDVLKKLEYLFCEPYDNENFIIKPVYGERYLEFLKLRQEYSQKEQQLCAGVLKELTGMAGKFQKEIEDALSFAADADVFIARARLALKFNLTKPQLDAKEIKIVNGVYLPLQAQAEKYTPLTATFSKNLTVITGSNMGGKTEVLRSTAFFQLLAQAGFFVPCAEFRTKVFKHFHYLGEDRRKTSGLSSFGLDVYNFVKAFETGGEESVYFIDEFARTTNAAEAKALINAVLKVFAANEKITAFFTTHFSGLAANEKVFFCRMAGLNHEEFGKHLQVSRNCDLQERLKTINAFMRYEIAQQEAGAGCDAVNIAVALGMDKRITDEAFKELER